MAPTNTEFFWAVLFFAVIISAIVGALGVAVVRCWRNAVLAFNRALERKMYPLTKDDDAAFY